MNSWLQVVVLAAVLHGCFAPPVTQNKKDGVKEEHAEDGMADYMEYHRYLREVVNALESDPEFRSKLEGAKEEDIRSGKIAHELEFVSHHIRTRLDEIKRTELDRLRDLMQRKMDLMENNSIDDPLHNHLDHSNQHTFEIEDLKKLIAKTTEDLAEADRKRREEFKEYELQKEYEKQQKLNHTNGDDREKLEHEFVEKEQKHKKHEKLHEPGHKQQLEQVWEEQDQMQLDFDPKTFFMLHDLDSNGLWDETEVKALFIKELDKMYQAGEPEDDMRERAEEMERMRESVMAEVDLNKDGFIDYSEFLAQTKRNDYSQDNGWQGLDEQRQFTDEELQEYVRQHQAQQYPIHQGPPYPNQVQPGYHQPGPYHVPDYHPNDIHPQPQLHPGQLPQVQTNPQQLHYQQVPPQVNPQFPGGNQGGVPNLNTNEVYPNQAQQQQYPNQGQYQAVNANQGQYQQVNSNQGQRYNPNQGQQQLNQGQHQLNQGQHQLNQGQQQLNQGQPQFNQGQPQLNQGQQLNQGHQQLNNGQPQLNQGHQQLNQGQQQLNQGQAQLNQGQQQQINQAQQQNQGNVAPNVRVEQQIHPNPIGGQVPINEPNQIPKANSV